MSEWLTRAAVAALLDCHGFGLVRLHSLRHAAAVAMLDNVNGDLRVVSATLGHTSLRITADVYGADADAARKRGSEAMDRAMERREAK